MAGLTKQQEIIVGVGVLVLLGYFAFGQQSTEKPLESAQGPSSGDDPATKEISAAIEFVKVQKEQQQAGQQMTSEVNARYNRFSQLFNEYAVLRQQVGNAMNTRTDQVRSRSKGGALNIYPLPDHLKAEIETLRKMCHTLQSESSGQFGILSLPLNDFQRRMVATTLEILTNHDLRLYEMALGNHLDAERDREAQQLVSWTQAVNNSQRYYTLNQQWINIQVQQPDVEMVDPPKKKKKIVGKGDASHLDRMTGMKPQDGLFNQDTAPTAAVDAGNNQTDRATATRNRAVGAVQAAIVGGSRGASDAAIAALPEFKYVPPRPATVIDDSQPFLLLGKTAPLPAQPNNLSLVKQTTDPANAAFNQAGGQNPHLSTALTTTNERTVDLTNIGDPAPKAQIAQVRVPTVEGNQVALIPNLRSAFQTIQPRPMLPF